MQLTKCPVCQQQVSPMASNCPSCGHPQPQELPTAWVKLSMQMPPVFYGMVFMGCGMAAIVVALSAVSSFAYAVSVMHQQFAAESAILAALLALIALIAAIAVDKRR